MRAASGRRFASQWLRPSIVCTCSRAGLRSRSQPRARLRASAAAASACSSCRWGSLPASNGRAADASARTMRWRISEAALRVNVIATISSGTSTVARSRRKRKVRRLVFPEPAGACTMNERRGSIASRRVAASRSRSAVMAGLLRGFLARAHRVDAAQGPEVAMTAGVRRELRIDDGATGRVVARERVEPRPPPLGDDAPLEAFLLVLRERETGGRFDAVDRDGLVSDAEKARAGAAGFGERDR